MLADDVEWVIGVDTHEQAHTAAVVDRLGGVTETLEFAADPAGYRRLLARVSERGGLRLWGVEGTGSRADLRTVGQATTIGVEGGTCALRRSRQVEVQVGERTGFVPSPDLAGGILIKARAAQNERSPKGLERHYQDLAFLLTLVTDPVLVRNQLGHRNRQHLRRILEDMGDTHPVWGLLSRADTSCARAALDLLCR